MKFTSKALVDCCISNENRQTKLSKIGINDEDNLIFVSRSVFIDNHDSRQQFKSRFTTQNLVISHFTIAIIYWSFTDHENAPYHPVYEWPA
jgi:hypothetical protein